MADNNANEALIRLEPGGIAPVISYNVPEPTSYTGRNFIDLQLPASYFVANAMPKSLVGGEPAPLVRTDVVEAALAADAKSASPLEGKPSGPMTPAMLGVALGVDIAPDERLSPELANLDLREVVAKARTGKRLNLYRTLNGTLTYNYITAVVEDDTRAPATAVAAHRQRGMSIIMEPGTIEEPDPIVLAIAITAPTAGATINGPATGAAVTITGTAQKVSGIGSVGRVDVRIGGGAFQPASSTNSWANWTYTTTLTAAGSYTITARAVHSGGFITEETSITVTVALAPPPDTAAPVIAITAPTNGATIQGPATGASVTVNGTAVDSGGSGIRVVELAVDASATYAPATPRAAGDWSTWSRTLTLATGARTITARCADNAGNVSTARISVTVVVPPPPDTTGPSLTVSTPVANAIVNGTFPSVTVTVSGAASDPSGIATVELSLDGSPAFVAAQPRVPGDWSQWSGSLQISQGGQHFISVRAVDRASTPNVTQQTIPITVNLMPEVVSRLTRLIIVETYRLSSYLGAYGAGRTIKTFSLLPGEKTKISVKTYTRRETDAKSASSIFDSLTEESARDFEKTMGNEQSNKRSYEESFNYKVGAEASASWGWGSAQASAELSGGTNAAREEFAKNISSATQKHSARASAKRDIQINTSYEVKEQSGEETALERTIENINGGRTLNFVFRQMNQEYITLLHLVDVRIGFFKVETVNGVDQYTYREFTLPQLNDLLRDVIQPDRVNTVRNTILYQLSNIFDYEDNHHSFVEIERFKDSSNNPIPNTEYLRTKKGYHSTYRDDATGTQITVPGIILAANKYVMRTEGIIVEALLGKGDGLDGYSHGVQDEAVRTRQLSNDQAALEAEKMRIALQIIREGNTEAAKLFQQLFPQPPVQLAPYILTPAPSTTDGQTS